MINTFSFGKERFVKMNEKIMMQQMTGVRLFNEEKRLLSEDEYLRFKEHMEENHTGKEQQVVNKEICEVYFDSSLPLEYQPEQFMLAVEKQGGSKKFLLKRRNKIGSYESEKTIKISKKEYRDILKGSIDWMKESKKTLINEFYCKMKLFQYKVSKILKCYREEIYMKYEQVLLTVNREIKEYNAGNNILNMAYDDKKVLVFVRSNARSSYDASKKVEIEQYIYD